MLMLGALRRDRRHGQPRTRQLLDHAGLAQHVVRVALMGAERRPAQHEPLTPGVAEGEGEIGAPAGDQLGLGGRRLHRRRLAG
jgi:hypothetical protein